MSSLEEKLLEYALRPLEDRPRRNIRTYPRVLEVDDCEECNGTGEVERSHDGSLVECAQCRPALRFRSRDEYEAYEAGVPARGEI